MFLHDSPVLTWSVLSLPPAAGPGAAARAAGHPRGLHQAGEGLPAGHHLRGGAEEAPHQALLHGPQREGQCWARLDDQRDFRFTIFLVFCDECSPAAGVHPQRSTII